MCAELAFGTPTLFFELLDAVTIPAAQPASLPELRVNAAAGRERLVMKQPRRATAVLGVLLALLRCVIGPAVPAPLTAAIVNGQNFRDSSTRIIGIAPLAAVAAETSHCSSASPCWLCASEKIEVLDGGAQLASIDSIKLLGYYTSGKGSESMCPADESQKNKVAHDERKLKGLISDSLLFALWMVDPWSHAFWFVREGRIHIIESPPEYYDSRIPYEATRSQGAAAGTSSQRGRVCSRPSAIGMCGE